MSNSSALRDVVERFGAITAIVVDDPSPSALSVAQIIFKNGTLTIEAIAHDDTLRASIEIEPNGHYYDVSNTAPWSRVVGGSPMWIWTLTNHEGYDDGIQIVVRLDGRDLGLQLIVTASSLKPWLLLEA